VTVGPYRFTLHNGTQYDANIYRIERDLMVRFSSRLTGCELWVRVAHSNIEHQAPAILVRVALRRV